MHRRTITQLLLLLLCGLVLSACYKSSNAVVTGQPVGVILTGSLEQYGWGNAHIQSATYATDTISNHEVMIYFNDTDMAAVAERLITQGARAIFVSFSSVDLSAIEAQHSDIIFIHNVGTRADVERMLPALNLSVTVQSGSQSNSSASTLVIVLIVISVILIFVIAQTVKSSVRGAVPAQPSASVIERLITRIQTEPGKSKKKRPTLANASVHGKAVRIQDRVESHQTDFAAQGQPEPLVRKLATYVQGYAHFDMSFAIETAKDEFLGEFGIGLAAAMPYDRDKGVAFEVWLFDKADIRTASQIVGSVLALSDVNILKTLKHKGAVQVIEPDSLWMLETAKLRLHVRILDVEYAYSTSDGQPNSSFEHVVFELAVWQK